MPGHRLLIMEDDGAMLGDRLGAQGTWCVIWTCAHDR
jgi:hypothetical protein